VTVACQGNMTVSREATAAQHATSFGYDSSGNLDDDHAADTAGGDQSNVRRIGSGRDQHRRSGKKTIPTDTPRPL